MCYRYCKVCVPHIFAYLTIIPHCSKFLASLRKRAARIYATSKPKVVSDATIFDSLWHQTELYEKLRKANVQLQNNDKLQHEFINIAAHELRTPIQPLLGIADILDSQFSKGEEKGEITREELAVIQRNAKRLERLSYDILQVTRIESGWLTLNIQDLNLNDILSPLVDDARIKTDSGNRGVKIQYSPLDNNNIILKGDRSKLSEVVWNLLSNAIKFTGKGGDISINTKKDDVTNLVTVIIKDTGSGIDTKILPKLFNKFVSKSEKGGTGLGLFISKSIVEAHGGKIWAQNNSDGRGATFSFTLPVWT